jgi:hypothetical protein
VSVPQEIVDLLEDYVDGVLDPSGEEALSLWIGKSDTNCRSVAEWFLAEAQLHEASRLADMRDVFRSLPFSLPSGEIPGEPALSSITKRQRYIRGVGYAAAIVTIFAASVLWMATKIQRHDVQRLASATPRLAPVQQSSPAIVGRLSDCVWATGAKPFRVGEEIAAGTMIDIKSGLAQLVFESGAELVIKGPCALRIDNAMLCRLFAGSVSAEVPHRAAGFTIRGPAAEVIDLGTRFGFSVGDAGNSEVHVFQGEVISRQLDESGGVVGKEIRLKKNQAILFPGAKRQAQRLAANEAKFALEVKPLWLNDTIQPLAVDRKLALWLRAAHGVQRDKLNHVVAWQDLAIGSNHISNDAFQPDRKLRPQYLADAFNGHPAIRFDGMATFLTTIPITTTNDQTIVAVFQYAEPATPGYVGGQLLNYNGPPSRYLPDIYNPGVLQLGEKIDSWNVAPSSIAAKAFVGRDSRGADVSAGVVVSKPIGYSQPHVVAYVYGNSQNKAALYVDAEFAAESSAPTSVAVTSRKVIGKHGIFDQWYFHGDIAEILIFNTALRPAEITALNRQLMEYYGISARVSDNRDRQS